MNVFVGTFDTFLFQGDPANGMFFVENGRVNVVKRGSNGEEKTVISNINTSYHEQNRMDTNITQYIW